MVRRLAHRRKGVSAVQWAVVAALITLVVFASVKVVGTRTNHKMNQTATDMADPTKLTKRFGNGT